MLKMVSAALPDIPIADQVDPVPRDIQEALRSFEMRHPVDIPAIKKRYKELVKRYHPDISKEDSAEERFKEIHKSYKLLTESQEIA